VSCEETGLPQNCGAIFKLPDGSFHLMLKLNKAETVNASQFSPKLKKQKTKKDVKHVRRFLFEVVAFFSGLYRFKSFLSRITASIWALLTKDIEERLRPNQ